MSGSDFHTSKIINLNEIYAQDSPLFVSSQDCSATAAPFFGTPAVSGHAGGAPEYLTLLPCTIDITIQLDSRVARYQSANIFFDPIYLNAIYQKNHQRAYQQAAVPKPTNYGIKR